MLSDRVDFVMYALYMLSFALKFFENELLTSKFLFACNTFVLFLRYLRLFAKHPMVWKDI